MKQGAQMLQGGQSQRVVEDANSCSDKFILKSVNVETVRVSPCQSEGCIPEHDPEDDWETMQV